MSGTHTVEKIGGTSMSRFGEVMKNVIVGSRSNDELYNRILVVSAYGGITNALLEDKKTGAPGVYARFAASAEDWVDHLEGVREMMRSSNRSFEDIGLIQDEADAFVDERIDGIRTCLQDLMRVRSYGHMLPENYLPASREMLSAAGEAHSAFNSARILQANGIQARFVDLTCWKQTDILSLDDAILRGMKGVDIAAELPVATGYVKCDMGIMTHFDRGYSEYTFSKLCVLTDAREGIIHKEYHLCTGDPVLVGPDRARVIGNTNFDIADQMSDMNMEAVHARAAKELQLHNIPLRVKNAFEPEHPGTLISADYISPVAKVEMVCGREDLLAIEVFDSDMVGQAGYDHRLLTAFVEHGLSYIAKSTNANTITHYVPERSSRKDECLEMLRLEFPEADITTRPVAIISVLGTNLPFPGILRDACGALCDVGVDILGINQATHRVSIQIVVAREQAEAAQLALHARLVEQA